MTKLKPRITLIGGSGFVGTNLCARLLKCGMPFQIIDLQKSQAFPDKWTFGDVRDINSLRSSITGDVVILLAAVHRDDVVEKESYRQTNIIGAQNVATVCREKGIKDFIFTSSVAVYGVAKGVADETAPTIPLNDYGVSKLKAEEILQQWSENSNARLVTIRPTVIFGTGNRGNVYNLFKQIGSGRFFMVGKGENRKALAYIDNVVEFIMVCLANREMSGIYNFADEPLLDMKSLVSLVRKKLVGKDNVGVAIPYHLGLFAGYFFDCVAKVVGRPMVISSARVRKFCSESNFSSSRIPQDFHSPTTLIAGIERTLTEEFIEPDPNRPIFHTE